MENHLAQAKHNEDFLESMSGNFPEEFIDWQITVCFYAAVHYVEAFVSFNGHTCQNHDDRKDKIDPGTKDLGCNLSHEAFKQYILLKKASNDCRYNGFQEGLKDLWNKQLIKDLRTSKRRFETIKSFCMRKVNENAA